jgi:hypothetical protein
MPFLFWVFFIMGISIIPIIHICIIHKQALGINLQLVRLDIRSNALICARPLFNESMIGPANTSVKMTLLIIH